MLKASGDAVIFPRCQFPVQFNFFEELHAEKDARTFEKLDFLDAKIVQKLLAEMEEIKYQAVTSNHGRDSGRHASAKVCNFLPVHMKTGTYRIK
jgi:hypothetical protein